MQSVYPPQPKKCLGFFFNISSNSGLSDVWNSIVWAKFSTSISFFTNLSGWSFDLFSPFFYFFSFHTHLFNTYIYLYSMNWIQQYNGFLRSLRIFYFLFNLRNYKSLKRNIVLYKQFGLKKSIFRLFNIPILKN